MIKLIPCQKRVYGSTFYSHKINQFRFTQMKNKQFHAIIKKNINNRHDTELTRSPIIVDTPHSHFYLSHNYHMRLLQISIAIYGIPDTS